MMKPAAFGLAASLAIGFSVGCLAEDLVATQEFSGTKVGFQLRGAYSNVTLTISGPNDFHASASSERGAPAIDLRKFGPVADGQYTYQLTAATEERVKVRTKLDDGRADSAAESRKGVATSGTFNVQKGAIVPRKATQKTRRDSPNPR